MLNLTDKERCFAIAMVQALVYYGDGNRTLRETWRELFEGKNCHEWCEHLCKKVWLHGVYSADWISARTNPDHEQHLTGAAAISRVKGLRYEIALALRYIRPDFPLPKAEKKHLNDDEYANLVNRHYPNVENPAGGGNPHLDPLFRQAG